MSESSSQLSIIQTKGSLDWAYPPMILASTGRVMDKDVHIFFTFYGLRCLLKDSRSLSVSPVGNPAMPVHLPFGPRWLRQQDLRQSIPDLIWSMPGVTRFATWSFKKKLAEQGQLPFEELRTLCLELGVKMTACEMSIELMGFKHSDFIDGIDYAGAATYFGSSPENQSLFI
ncbi:DsrE/DsrF/DrsH-like family protein [Thiomicrospira microaerophila]|uniref:DsrE/DsrF/DrsH-like family protein n=1 Tax=Thiomicrospira microaerophila TaxID=406020 RepID=UPI0024B20D1E|nr:DsrE/DsrF/DrsH-like family protein [Thiomicrospira microaerophila]UQB43038.1 DsrE/DsrF/DrsH-like family protein [Thiomicrospira microaerophila]